MGDLAGRSGDAKLIELATGSPDWSIIPLRMNYSRPIGYIRCNLVDIEARFEKARHRGP